MVIGWKRKTWLCNMPQFQECQHSRCTGNSTIHRVAGRQGWAIWQHTFPTTGRAAKENYGTQTAHKKATTLTTDAQNNVMPNVVAAQQSEHYDTTRRVFRTVYNQVMLGRPFIDLQSNIDVQRLNELNMACILHSNISCANITAHMSPQRCEKNCITNCIKSIFNCCSYRWIHYAKPEDDPHYLHLNSVSWTDWQAGLCFSRLGWVRGNHSRQHCHCTTE